MSTTSSDHVAQGDGSYIKTWTAYQISPSNNNDKVHEFYVDFELRDVRCVHEESVGWKLYPVRAAIPIVRQELPPQDKYYVNRHRIRYALESLGIQEPSFQDEVITSLEAEFTGTGLEHKFRQNPELSQGSILLVRFRMVRFTNSKSSEVAGEELVRVDNEGRLFKDNEKIDCPICLEELSIKGDDYVVELPHCDHVFHRHCIKRWFIKAQACPLCRSTCLPEPRTPHEIVN